MHERHMKHKGGTGNNAFRGKVFVRRAGVRAARGWGGEVVPGVDLEGCRTGPPRDVKRAMFGGK